MESLVSLVVIFCCVVALVGHLCIGTVKGDGPASMTFKAPNISEEEAHSNFIPEQLKCDACRIVAYQLYWNFEKFNEAHQNYKKNLPESEILDIVDGVCNNKDTFNVYGIKSVKGINRLSGSGLETQDFPGLLSGGGRWPGRLMEVCSSFVEELGEEEIYEIYRRDPSDSKALEKALCKGSGVFSKCSNLLEEQKSEL